MAMTKQAAEAIAKLLNSQNRLMVPYTAAKILAHADRYIVRYNDNGHVVGAAEVESVQWYQGEIKHVSVDPEAKRQGIGTWLVEHAEARARELGARVAQCTIRVGNAESEGLFKKNGYTATITFTNERSGNEVTVYQKVLAPSITA